MTPLGASVKKDEILGIVSDPFGEKEENEGTVSVRRHGEGDKGTYSIEDFIALIKKEIEKTVIPFHN